MFDAVRASLSSKLILGLERILIRICIEIDEHHPADTMAGKRDMLERLSKEMPVPASLNYRAAVITDETKETLNDLLRFRRAQRGCYTAQLVELDLAANTRYTL